MCFSHLFSWVLQFSFSPSNMLLQVWGQKSENFVDYKIIGEKYFKRKKAIVVVSLVKEGHR